jgi:hypothetical protein
LATSDGKTELCTRHLLVANSSTDRKGQPQIAIERIVVFRTSLVSSYWTLLLYFVRGDLLHFLAQLSVYPSEESPPAHRPRIDLDPIFTKSWVRKSVPCRAPSSQVRPTPMALYLLCNSKKPRYSYCDRQTSSDPPGFLSTLEAEPKSTVTSTGAMALRNTTLECWNWFASKTDADSKSSDLSPAFLIARGRRKNVDQPLVPRLHHR